MPKTRHPFALVCRCGLADLEVVCFAWGFPFQLGRAGFKTKYFVKMKRGNQSNIPLDKQRKKSNASNIKIKVPDMEWKTTGRNVRTAASHENPEYALHLVPFLQLPLPPFLRSILLAPYGAL